MSRKRKPQERERTPQPEHVEAPAVSAPGVTVERVFRGSTDAITAAFVHCERLKRRTRKLTREEWQEELEAFRSAKR